jgi:hypothetical protein
MAVNTVPLGQLLRLYMTRIAVGGLWSWLDNAGGASEWAGCAAEAIA